VHLVGFIVRIYHDAGHLNVKFPFDLYGDVLLPLKKELNIVILFACLIGLRCLRLFQT